SRRSTRASATRASFPRSLRNSSPSAPLPRPVTSGPPARIRGPPQPAPTGEDSMAEPAATRIKDEAGPVIERLFSTPGVDPFDEVEWELRTSRIGHGDSVAFEQRDVEFP